jgi:hypothetical protein
MAYDPFRLEPPAVISFSGGRTSGLMLRRVLDAHGGKLPPGVLPVFCNTGKERAETLDFVEECSRRWAVPITWLEYRHEGGKHAFAAVDYATASRAGEPFAAAIQSRKFLPNPVTRFCTSELKIRTTNRYVRQALGWAEYDNAVGLRRDEPGRVGRLRSRGNHVPGEEPVCPLYDAGTTLADVMAFWAAQPFDLRLRQHEGNCDLCFLKGVAKLRDILERRPDLAGWWIEHEQAVAKMGTSETARFRSDRPSYAGLLKMVREQRLFDWGGPDEPDELGEACHCTD